jgi:2-polyprenyl-3-methyl-5-hydroxy-6-metoxy-1,4-benzoquinol methylase
MLRQRRRGVEWLDAEDLTPDVVHETFAMLPTVNRWFGGVRPVLAFFRRESRAWAPGQVVRILDVGCGVGDVGVALVRWARQRGHRLQVHGIDRHPLIVELAQENCKGYPEIEISCANVLTLHPGEAGPHYDYVHASQVVHHFPDEEVVPLLRHMLGLCRQKVVINDLVRAPLHYLATWVFTLFAPRTFRHDGRISITRGFRLDELAALLRAGGLHRFSLEKHFFYRFLLILPKESS